MESYPKIKVLIADDERLVRIGLKQTISWANYNMEVVCDVSNGALAWEEFGKCQPQLVITDISMPLMDGIELTRKIKESSPTTKILFLSCHRDFQYAKEGMQLGVSGYILKTDMNDDEEFNNHLSSIEKEINQQSHGDNPHQVTGGLEQYQRDRQLVMWLQGLKPVEEFKSLLKPNLRDKQFPMKVFLVEFESQNGTTYFQQQFKQKYPEDELEMIRYSNKMCFLLSPLASIEPAVQFLIDEKIRTNAINWVKRGPVDSLDDIFHSIEVMFKEWELQSITSGENHSISDPIMKSILYIDKHLEENINADKLSQMIGFSRSHFSTLFKKEVGMCYISYVQVKRLEKAKLLLKSTDWKLNKIAEKVGMGDYKHFSKWFKKHTCITPSQYRT